MTAEHADFVERFGRVDILINNAGAARGDDRVPVVELTVDCGMTWH